MSEVTPDPNSWRIGEWFPDIQEKAHKQLKVYFDALVLGNKTMSLIPIKNAGAIDALYFADSILASRIIYKSIAGVKEFYDLSQGVGFPGLVFATLYPDVTVHITVADSKKFDFLRQVLMSSGLNNVNIIQKPLEALPENSIAVGVVRGTNTITKNLLLARKCFNKGGTLFHIKGEEWGLEVSEIPTQLCSVWSPSLVSDYKLPIGKFKFSVVKTEKIG